MEIFEINLQQPHTNLVQLFIAFILPMFIVWEWESSTRTAGLLTFPLVSTAACSFTVLATTMYSDPSAAGKIVAGIITGIGFIGAGAILKDKFSISGTSTAAAILGNRRDWYCCGA